MKFKEGIDKEDLAMLTPKMLIVLGYASLFAEKNGLPFTVTNIKHKFEESISNTHPEGRAVDISVEGWTHEDSDKLVLFLEQNCEELGAVGGMSGIRRIVVRHDVGYGDHIHLQVER